MSFIERNGTAIDPDDETDNDADVTPPGKPRQRPQGRIINNPEILAMHDLATAIESLSELERDRVLTWMNSKYATIDTSPLDPRD